MTLWHYTAINHAGRSVSGTQEAPDEPTVLKRLHRDGVMPLSVTATGGASGLLGAAFGGERLTRQQVTYITRELATMLGAGQDIDRALRFLAETAPTRKVARIIGAVRDDVRDGRALAVALARYPDSFSRLYVGLVRAGEASGSLGPTLERLADLEERERSLSATVRSALIYPTLLVVASIGAIVLLLVYVLPQFVPLFEQSAAALPASTQFLIDAGNAVSRDGPKACLVLLILTLVAMAAARRPGVRLAVDRVKLKLPVFGHLAREAMAARLARTLGTLLQNRVPLIAALGITREVLENAAGTAAVDTAAEAAKSGNGLARSLGESGLFPPRLVHLLLLGEETAQLGPMALRAAAIHEEAVRMITQRLVALLTPAITIGMGAVIAGIVASLLTAMLSLNDLAQ